MSLLVLSGLPTFAQTADPALGARQAFRTAVYGGNAAQRAEAIRKGLRSADPLIRRQALWELSCDDRQQTVAVIRKMKADPSPTVGQMVAELAVLIEDEKSRVAFLRELAQTTTNDAVKSAAVRVMGFPFHRENVAASQDPQNDHQPVLVAKFDLTTDWWMFHHDRTGDAHLKEVPYYSPGFNFRKDPEKGWRRISIGKYWEEDGAGAYYDGIGWYLRTFTLPERPKDGDSCELCFDSVDDEAWVWLNGTFLGQHAEGIEGCGKPFRLGADAELKWGAENTILVRVNDLGRAGGIDKGIRVEVLTCK